MVLNIASPDSSVSAAKTNVKTSGNLDDHSYDGDQKSGPWSHHAGTATGPT